MRSVLIPIAAVALIAAGCSDDADTSDAVATSDAGPSSDATTTSTTSAPASTTTAAKPVSASTTTVPTTETATPATITPDVVCVGSSGGDPIYFAYSNSGSGPVVIEATADNVLDGALADDAALIPTVFASGRVSPAFWAYPDADDETELAWTVKGPDGVARTATASASTPVCTDALLTPTVVDTRTPTLAFSYDAVPEFSDPPQQADFLATVVGVPSESTCASGLEPSAAEIWTDDGNGGSVNIGTTVRQTLPFEPFTDPATNESYLVAQTRVAAMVVDVCGANGSVSKSWPIGARFERLRTGVLVCLRAADGRITMEVQDLSVPVTCVGAPLPQTGGVRTRTLPP